MRKHGLVEAGKALDDALKMPAKILPFTQQEEKQEVS